MELLSHLQSVAILQISLEVWGIFIALFSQWTFARFLKTGTLAKSDKFLFIAVSFAIAEILLDIVAKLVRGYPGDAGYVAVRLANFSYFLAVYCLLWAFVKYVQAHFSGVAAQRNRGYFLVSKILIALVISLLVINIFTGWFYNFDAQNLYYRATYYPPLQVIPLTVLVLVMVVLVRERRQLKRRHLLALLSFITLPAVSVLLSIPFYGFSFLEISFVVSLLIIQEERRLSLIDHNSRLEELNRSSGDMVYTLAYVIDARDHYTNGHSTRVAKYSKEIARRMGLSEEQQLEIECSSLLHDIGKVHVPDAILHKPGKLTDEESEKVREHTVIGAEILARLSSKYNLVDGARYHHERYDGTGYPEGLVGEQIPLVARIIAVADADDAMTSERMYHQPKSQEEARLEIIEGLGKQFDPQAGKTMLQMIDEDTEFLLRECSAA